MSKSELAKLFETTYRAWMIVCFQDARALYYRRLIVPKIYAVHLATVNGAKYLLYRKYWTDWRELRDFQRFPRLEDYVRYRLKTDYNTESEEEGIRMAFMELAKSLVKCDYLLKNCPEVLKKS